MKNLTVEIRDGNARFYLRGFVSFIVPVSLTRFSRDSLYVLIGTHPILCVYLPVETIDQLKVYFNDPVSQLYKLELNVRVGLPEMVICLNSNETFLSYKSDDVVVSSVLPGMCNGFVRNFEGKLLSFTFIRKAKLTWGESVSILFG
jgi:hypothetical protein